MSDDAESKPVVIPPPAQADGAAFPPKAPTASGPETNGTKVEPSEVVLDDAHSNSPPSEHVNDKQPSEQPVKPASVSPAGDTKVPEEEVAENTAAAPADEATLETENSASIGKAGGRRKSGGVPEHKRKLNKKASKANLTHTDARPGDHYFARLKGFPPWPVIICDEQMLPNELIKSRPVSAAREDGTYREGYQDGGPKAKDRTYAIMYLHTNEFGWHKNTDLQDLDFDTVGNIPAKMRKDLQEAHRLAAEQHDLGFYKEVLKNFMEQKVANLLAQQQAAEAKAAAKAAAKAKKEKVKSQKAVVDDGEDVDMPDADANDSDGTGNTVKKRKAENQATPSDTSKKVKLAITFKAPHTPNGTPAAKAPKDSSSTKSSVKSKVKKATPKISATPEVAAPKEPELTNEEKRAKKEKEILFLRHKLQKGLLTRDSPPKEDEMKQMSEFISKLEGYSELEVSIIRATKINKVLKAIIKLPSIPREEEFNFKSRSQSLLDKWNKLLANEPGSSGASAVATATNGVADSKPAEETKPSLAEHWNGTTETSAPVAFEEQPDSSKPSAPEAPEKLNGPESTAAAAPEKSVEIPAQEASKEANTA